MTFEETSKLVQQWAIDRGLEDADSDRQIIKALEEAGEWASCYLRGDEFGVKDGLGDLLVVMTIFCLQYGIELQDCFDLAWDEIKDRTGRMFNGTFVKESDIKTNCVKPCEFPISHPLANHPDLFEKMLKENEEED